MTKTLEDLTCYTGNYATYKLIAITKDKKVLDLTREYIGLVNNDGNGSYVRMGEDLNKIILDENIASAYYTLFCPDPYDKSKELISSHVIK